MVKFNKRLLAGKIHARVDNPGNPLEHLFNGVCAAVAVHAGNLDRNFLNSHSNTPFVDISKYDWSGFKNLCGNCMGMKEPKITNLVKFYAVLLLSEKRHHGYELMKEIGKRLEKKVSPGQMYPFLAALEENRLVKAGRTGEREKTSFELTPLGKQFVKKNLHRFGGLIELAIEPHLSVCPCGCKVFEGGVERRVKGKKMKFCCHHCAKSHGR